MKTRRFRWLGSLLVAAFAIVAAVYLTGPFAASGHGSVLGDGLTGNWAVKTPRNDGTFSKVYFNLKQDGGKIVGTIRSTQFYYQITDSTGDGNGFTITGTMKDGTATRTVRYDGKLAGDELQLATRRRPEDKPTESVARRVPDGEGAMPAFCRFPPCTRSATTDSPNAAHGLEQLEPVQRPRERRGGPWRGRRHR